MPIQVITGSLAVRKGTTLRIREISTHLLLFLSVLGAQAQADTQGGTAGPDVTVHEIVGVQYGGSDGSLRAYTVGTISCNQGDEPVEWCDDSTCAPGAEVTDHPVIGQNLYRLKDGRFEQLGMSWLKHGFFALSNSDDECGDGSCETPDYYGDQLGIGCTDPYSATLNADRPLGKRSTVNPTTGDHPVRPNSGGSGIEELLQVEETEIDPTLNPSALYWVEAHYVTPDDASRGNGLNNASHRTATFNQTLDMSLTGNTAREKAAIFAWQVADPAVEIISTDIPASVPAERFHVARRVTAEDGYWHYEYAIHNLNSDRSARLFRIQLPTGTTIYNVGFRDVDHHSGEPYDTTDWASAFAVVSGTVEWSTTPFDTDKDANALRWGTTYSFWFDADAPPTGAVHTLEFFKPGSPTDVVVPFPDGGLFADGFETQDTTAWAATRPEP